MCKGSEVRNTRCVLGTESTVSAVELDLQTRGFRLRFTGPRVYPHTASPVGSRDQLPGLSFRCSFTECQVLAYANGSCEHSMPEAPFLCSWLLHEPPLVKPCVSVEQHKEFLWGDQVAGTPEQRGVSADSVRLLFGRTL